MASSSSRILKRKCASLRRPHFLVHSLHHTRRHYVLGSVGVAAFLGRYAARCSYFCTHCEETGLRPRGLYVSLFSFPQLYACGRRGALFSRIVVVFVFAPIPPQEVRTPLNIGFNAIRHTIRRRIDVKPTFNAIEGS